MLADRRQRLLVGIVTLAAACAGQPPDVAPGHESNALAGACAQVTLTARLEYKPKTRAVDASYHLPGRTMVFLVPDEIPVTQGGPGGDAGNGHVATFTFGKAGANVVCTYGGDGHGNNGGTRYVLSSCSNRATGGSNAEADSFALSIKKGDSKYPATEVQILLKERPATGGCTNGSVDASSPPADLATAMDAAVDHGAVVPPADLALPPADLALPPLSASAGANLTAIQGQVVTLAASASQPALAYTVDFGDGAAASGVTGVGGTAPQSHRYLDVGTYLATFTVRDAAGRTASATAQVAVGDAPPTVTVPSTASFVPGLGYRLVVGFSDFGTRETHTATINWGDGTSDVTHPDVTVGHFATTHLYATSGVYIVSVAVLDSNGGTGAAIQTLTVSVHQMIQLAVDLPTWIVAGEPLTGQVDATSTLPGTIAFTLSAAPVGMTIDPTTGAITWPTPTPGELDVTIQASDGTVTASATQHLVVSAVTTAASTTIGAAGGSLQVTDPQSPLYGARLDVPSGALSADTQIELGLIATSPADDLDVAAGPAIHLGPSGTVFATPATLTLPYSPASIATGQSEETLTLEYYAPSLPLEGRGHAMWLPLGSTVDQAAHTLTTPIDHFSTYRGKTWRAGDVAYYQTPHFRVRYALTGTGTPLGNDKYPGVRTGYVDGAPRYIQDLADFLETAYVAYAASGHYPLRPTGKLYDVRVAAYADGWLWGLVPGANGIGIGNTRVPLMIDNRMGDTELAHVSTALAYTCAHEFFHIVQTEAISSSFWIAQTRIKAHNLRWLLEATAVYQEAEVFPPANGKYDIEYQNPAVLYGGPVEAGDGYDRYVLFKYLQARVPGVDFPGLLFDAAAPAINSIGVFEGSRAFFYRFVSQHVTSTATLWAEFAVGYQVLRTDDWVKQVSMLKGLGLPVIGKAAGNETTSAPYVAPSALASANVTTPSLIPGGVLAFATDISAVVPLLVQKTVEVHVRPILNGAEYAVAYRRRTGSALRFVGAASVGQEIVSTETPQAGDVLVVGVYNDTAASVRGPARVETYFVYKPVPPPPTTGICSLFAGVEFCDGFAGYGVQERRDNVTMDQCMALPSQISAPYDCATQLYYIQYSVANWGRKVKCVDTYASWGTADMPIARPGLNFLAGGTAAGQLSSLPLPAECQQILDLAPRCDVGSLSCS